MEDLKVRISVLTYMVGTNIAATLAVLWQSLR